MLSKFLARFTGGQNQTAIILVSPEAPPKAGVLSYSVGKKEKSQKTRYIYSADYVGGKGANLMRLRAAGLNVPRFLLIPASECEDAFQRAA